MDASSILLQIRRELGLRRAHLAQLAGLSPSTVGRIEKRELDPSWGTLTRILESSGFQIVGERVEPTRDATAAVAARFVLDHVLGDDGDAAPLSRAKARAAKAKARASAAEAHTAAADGPDSETVAPPAGLADLQVWWERWSRTRWLSDPPTVNGIMGLAAHAAYVSAGKLQATPQRTVGDGRHWRELALRIDEAGFDYAVSDTPAGLEHPGESLLGTPRIYVSDPSQVIDVLRLEESAPDRGVPLVSAEWPEFDGVVEGFAIRFTSIGQAIMDGMLDTEGENRKAYRLLLHLLIDRYRLN